jgi:hypothetical protein
MYSKISITATVALAVVAVLFLVLTSCSTDSPRENARTIQTQAEQQLNEAENMATDLSVSDIQLTFKVKSKQCFGSAGCNLTVTPHIALRSSLNAYETYEITFNVYGDENGPVVNTVTITGDNLAYHDIFIGTPNSSTKVRGKVTSVEKVTSLCIGHAVRSSVVLLY